MCSCNRIHISDCTLLPQTSSYPTSSGIAYLGGTCSAKRKCVVAEDNGLNLAFTIAHELGH
ncbi:A disintegrin and metalloproteinase with thrombospondin motifs 17-like, partial [Tachysurus ichikawai]